MLKKPKDVDMNNENTFRPTYSSNLKSKTFFLQTKLSTLSTTSDRKKTTMFITPHNLSTHSHNTFNNNNNNSNTPYYYHNHPKSTTPSKTLTSGFLTKSSSQRSFRAFSSSPLYINFPLSFPPLRKTLNNYHRTKSDVVLNAYSKLNSLHKETLKSKLTSTYKKFFLTIPSNHQINKENLCDSLSHTLRNNTLSPLDKTLLKKTPKILGNKLKMYPTLSYKDFTKQVLNQLRCGVVFANMRKELFSKVSDMNFQLDEVNNTIRTIHKHKKALDVYLNQFNAYNKYLRYKVNDELLLLDDLHKTKIDLEYEVKNLKDKVTQREKIVSNVKSFNNLIKKCLGCELNENMTCEIFFDKINYVENQTLSNIEKYQCKYNEVIQLQNEKSELENIIQTKEIYQNKQNAKLYKQLNNIKKQYLILTHSKTQILNDIENAKSSLSRKKHYISHNNTSNTKEKNNDITKIQFEMKFEQLSKDNPLLFTCIAVMLSDVIHNITTLNKEFLAIKMDDNSFICTEKQLNQIINMKYNHNNISKVFGNIMLMIKIVDRSYEKIVNEINNIKCNGKDKDDFVNEIIEQIKDKKKHKFIKEQKKVLEKIRNEKMQKVVNKLRGLTYINKRRIFPEMEFNNNKFNSNMNINKYKIINKLATKSNEQLNGTDTLEMLQY